MSYYTTVADGFRAGVRVTCPLLEDDMVNRLTGRTFALFALDKMRIEIIKGSRAPEMSAEQHQLGQ